MGLCVNGEEGDVSCNKVNKFWSRVESTTNYYERTFNENNNFPDSQKICAGMYKELEIAASS